VLHLQPDWSRLGQQQRRHRDIQRGTDSTLGKCLTQTFSENSQGTNSGTDNHAGFVAASDSLLDDMSGAAQAIPFDAMIHGLGGFFFILFYFVFVLKSRRPDAYFAYLLGAISGLQDVLATADQRK
jgi:hypothetical protein